MKGELTGMDLGGGCRGAPPPSPEMTCGFLIQLVFCKKKKLCGLLVLKQSKRRVHPLLTKNLDPPLVKVGLRELANFPLFFWVFYAFTKRIEQIHSY